MDYKPPPVDMQALVAFNSNLASQALPQLYADGHRALALEWAPTLDILQNTALRKTADPPATFDFSSRRLPTWASLADLVIHHRDIAALDALEKYPRLAHLLFTDRCDWMAHAAARELREHPDFSSYIFERLAPPSGGSTKNQFGSSGISKLAEAAAKEGRHEWFARLNELRIATEGESIRGDQLMSVLMEPSDKPFDIQAARALILTRSVPARALRELAAKLFASSSPSEQTYAIEVLGLHAQAKKTEFEAGSGGRAQSLREALSEEALYAKPSSTPPEWLRFHLALGLEPCQQISDRKPSLACLLVGAPWRDEEMRSQRTDASQVGMVRAREDQLRSELLTAMLNVTTQGLDDRMDVAAFGKEVLESFRGARKLDLLSACVGQGFFRCADVLLAHGADPTWAMKQCPQWLGKTLGDDHEAVPSALAYCEALALRRVSISSAARSQARRQGNGQVESDPAPNRPHRL